MWTKEQVETWLLENCTMASSENCANGTGLVSIHQMVFGHKRNVAKAKCVPELAAFYADPRNVTAIWNADANVVVKLLNAGANAAAFANGSELIPEYCMTEVERAFAAMIVRYGGEEYELASKQLALDYKLDTTVKSYFNSRREDMYDRQNSYDRYRLVFLHVMQKYRPRSYLDALFPGGKCMPPFVIEVLKPILPPLTFHYEAYLPGHDDYVICREDRVSDFAALVRFVAGEEFKVKPQTYDITKAKCAKLAEALGFTELCDADGYFGTPKEVKRPCDFMVALPMFVLACDLGLLEADLTGRVCPGKNAVSLLAVDMSELAKKLFDNYMASLRICETHYLPYLTIRDGDKCVMWDYCRGIVVEMLKGCPLGQWVCFEDFAQALLRAHGDFFRRYLSSTISIQGLSFDEEFFGSYYRPDWDECEMQILRLMLSFLGAIGVLDIAYIEGVQRCKIVYDVHCLGIGGFRITKLGAWILGLAEKSETHAEHASEEEAGGLFVQPDYTVVLTGLATRVAHESFLSAFLTKIVADPNVAMYKIDFASMLRAFNQPTRVEPKQIRAYLEEASARPLPENVARAFDDWQGKVGRVRIRTVTLLETDSEALLQELVHARGMDKLVDDSLVHAAVIPNAANAPAVRKIAEKEGWLVVQGADK